MHAMRAALERRLRPNRLGQGDFRRFEPQRIKIANINCLREIHTSLAVKRCRRYSSQVLKERN
jgi:hypothetical protein